jgi:hypothetical protein
MFRAYNVFSVLRPARPRHPVVQAIFALLAVCAFVVLLLVGAAIALVVMAFGVLLRAFSPLRPAGVPSGAHARGPADPPSVDGDIIDGEFKVVEKSLPYGTH